MNILFYQNVPDKKNVPKTFLVKDIKNIFIKYIFPGCRNPIIMIFKELLNITEIEATIQASTTYIFMKVLEKIFGLLTFEHEKQCGNKSFRVDLYIKELKLYIECDENDHKSYDIKKEEIRKKFFERPENICACGETFVFL